MDEIDIWWSRKNSNHVLLREA